MAISSVLHIISYGCILTFICAVAVKLVRYFSMPIHLRWEIYPVAHETGGRARYGGSYMEDADWWTHPRKTSLWGELLGMLPEMIFIKSVWEYNRKLWYRTFPFHFGLYCCIFFLLFLVLGAILEIAGIPLAPGTGIIGIVYYLTSCMGFFGMVLTTVGALGLLERRFTDYNLRIYTKLSDIFNLVFILVTILIALAASMYDPGMYEFRAFIKSCIIADFSYAPENMTVILAIILSSLLIAYIPLTHMAHFFIKWFTYHHVRWEDAPNVKGGSMENKIKQVMRYPVTWPATHINPDGQKKTWIDVVMEEPSQKEKK